MKTDTGDIIHFSVDEVGGEQGGILWPSKEEAIEVLRDKLARNPTTLYEITPVIIYEATYGGGA